MTDIHGPPRPVIFIELVGKYGAVFVRADAVTAVYEEDGPQAPRCFVVLVGQREVIVEESAKSVVAKLIEVL